MSHLCADRSGLVGDESNNKQGRMSQSKLVTVYNIGAIFAGVYISFLLLCVYTVYNNAYVFGDLWSN